MAGSETTAPLPQPETVAALPVTASTTAPQPNPSTAAALPRSQATVTLPSGTVVTLPAGMIPIFPPKSLATFGGVGQLIIRAAAGTRLPIAAAGTLAAAAKGGHFATAAFSGTGVWEPGIYARQAVVGYTAAGTLVATGKPGTRMQATGAGTLTTKTGTAAKMLNSGVGGPRFTTSARAFVNFNGTGGLTMAATQFATQGAYLSANQTIGGYSSAFFSPLSPLPAYPGSVASGSTLTVVGAGAATVTGTFANIGAWQSINLYRNGVKIVSGAASTSPISWSGTLAHGDQIQLEIVYNNGGSLPVTAGTTNVTLTVTPT